MKLLLIVLRKDRFKHSHSTALPAEVNLLNLDYELFVYELSCLSGQLAECGHYYPLSLNQTY